MQFATKVYNRVASGLLADEFIVFSSVVATKKTHKIRLSGFQLSARTDTERSGVLFFGRIQPYKGIRHLPLIAKKLGTRDPNVRIRVVGAGFDPHLRELEKCENVDVLNTFIPEEQLDKELSETAVVILPYDSATQSGVVIKSFAFGVPVVAFDVGNLREYISDGLSGRLVKHADLDDFVDAVLDTITNQKRFSEIILNNFDQDFGVQALTSQYSSLLQQWRETKC
jgi:glycosyltransferase involved in cell wall biosynthesis